MAFFYKYEYTNKRKNIHPCQLDETFSVFLGSRSRAGSDFDGQLMVVFKTVAWMIF